MTVVKLAVTSVSVVLYRRYIFSCSTVSKYSLCLSPPLPLSLEYHITVMRQRRPVDVGFFWTVAPPAVT